MYVNLYKPYLSFVNRIGWSAESGGQRLRPGQFSRSSTKQVLVNAHTLSQSMQNKIQAFLDRGEIRDCFDIEFLIRRGVALPLTSAGLIPELQKKIARFKDVDFRVKLESILEKDIRDYYVENHFSFLEAKLAILIAGTSPS